ncbi:hypothetical protein FE391_04305 [Nonomuraea sp. KC401]|uniref:hypothetical protein n=1 Tax=unclassified Nonomuraea TaxID=2593643 RepID=UPI0010FE3896|nr:MULTISPECIES: hypothetical protein [unclassified Nonomuraea]NBE95903.1 hypothetical protein [Nonomuraea sp. K271]TLF83490.1 hypothetical protein FE391_04305 [Nonomuraea sp. KC401]
MGSRTAISAGVLAVALGAVPVAAPAAAAATTQDCTRSGGVLSGVTNTLCDVVGAVTGTVDTLTGGVTGKVTDGLDKTTDEVLGRVGRAVPTGRPKNTRTVEPSPSPSPRGEEERDSSEGVCPRGPACADGEVYSTLSPQPTSPARRPARPRAGQKDSSVVPGTSKTHRPESRPQLMDTRRRLADKKRADPEEPRVDLLWPNPFAHELSVPMQQQRVVRPSPPASDVLGTALTIALLGSAVLAARIVQQRRSRTEPAESIPFEPARAANGRHRLA